ncbi:hypothetical protein L1987_11633 [Smallanthus sonchifolius]|uniref:Uncharacterized protein n=1 Tax=Smallanthus sonchifolius TaxID=185202 RepID=A0ACB9JE60_9ASTR|nr:hypothetical protein L1987_11633 [Smallanthus sonchifolius]
MNSKYSSFCLLYKLVCYLFLFKTRKCRDGERNQEGDIVGRRWSSGGGHHLPFPQSEYDTCNRQQSEHSKLQNLAGQHTDVLENLIPTVRKQVEVLRDIQSEHDEIGAKIF